MACFYHPPPGTDYMATCYSKYFTRYLVTKEETNRRSDLTSVVEGNKWYRIQRRRYYINTGYKCLDHWYCFRKLPPDFRWVLLWSWWTPNTLPSSIQLSWKKFPNMSGIKRPTAIKEKNVFPRSEYDQVRQQLHTIKTIKDHTDGWFVLVLWKHFPSFMRLKKRDLSNSVLSFLCRSQNGHNRSPSLRLRPTIPNALRSELHIYSMLKCTECSAMWKSWWLKIIDLVRQISDWFVLCMTPCGYWKVNRDTLGIDKLIFLFVL